MRFRLPNPASVATNLRDLARRKPEEAEEYLDSHQTEWEALAESNPPDAADILEALDEEGAADLLTDLETDEGAEVLNEMRPEPAADVVEEMEAEAAAAYIEEMEADQAADLLEALEDDDQRENIVSLLSPDASDAVLGLLRYPSDSAGGLMTTDIATLPAAMTAGESIEALRRLHDELGSNLSYVYVIDDGGHLNGVVSFRDLTFAGPNTPLDVVMMEDPVAVTTDTDREIVADLVQRFHLLAVPVVDDVGVLVGMVRFDEAMEAGRDEATEDMALTVGAGAEETVFTPVHVSVTRRLPWITLNVIVGLFIAVLITQFEELIGEHSILIAYMPLVALVAGNSGAQSLAVVIRSMAVGDLPPGRAQRAVRRELAVGLINGVVIAVVAGIGGLVITGDSGIGWVIAIAVLVDFFVAGLAGAGIPVLLRRWGQDPALASHIFLTMLTDIVGFAAFLFTATLLL
jgi:magnesium transporter